MSEIFVNEHFDDVKDVPPPTNTYLNAKNTVASWLFTGDHKRIAQPGSATTQGWVAAIRPKYGDGVHARDA